MYCEKCGKENVEGSSFCQYCGKAISVTESKQSPEAVAQAEPVAQSEALAVPQEEKKESPIKKIYGFLAAVLGLFLIFTVLLPSLGIKNPISNFVADSRNNGKGTSEIEVVVDACLNAIKHKDVSYLEKYIDENLKCDYSFIYSEKDYDVSKIDISTAEYDIIEEYTVDGIECMRLEVYAKGKGLIKRICDTCYEMQNTESSQLPALKKQLKQNKKEIDNIMKAIKAGLVTKSTKAELERLEEEQECIEVEIAKEQIVRPIIPREHIEAWILNFAKTDLKSQEQKQRLIDIFVNSVHVYDDKIVVIFNYKDGERCIRIDDVKLNTKKENTQKSECSTSIKFGEASALISEKFSMLSAISSFVGISAGSSL